MPETWLFTFIFPTILSAIEETGFRKANKPVVTQSRCSPTPKTPPVSISFPCLTHFPGNKLQLWCPDMLTKGWCKRKSSDPSRKTLEIQAIWRQWLYLSVSPRALPRAWARGSHQEGWKRRRGKGRRERSLGPQRKESLTQGHSEPDSNPDLTPTLGPFPF